MVEMNQNGKWQEKRNYLRCKYDLVLERLSKHSSRNEELHGNFPLLSVMV